MTIPNWLKVFWFFPNILLRSADYNPLMYFWKLFFNPPSLKHQFKLDWLDYSIYTFCIGVFAVEYQFFGVKLDYNFDKLPTTFALLIALGFCLYLFGMPVFVLLSSIFVYPVLMLWRVGKWAYKKFLTRTKP